MDTYSIGTSYLVIGYIPVYIIIIAGVGGFFYGKYKHKHASNDIPLFILYIL